MTESKTGSCLCKAIKFRLNAEIINTANCHCNTCKKITGAAFETIAVLNKADLEIFEGLDKLKTYQVTDNTEKNFCGTCGTPIYNTHLGYPGRAMVQVGALDDPTGVTPLFNIHTENMLPWVPALDELKNFEQGFKK